MIPLGKNGRLTAIDLFCGAGGVTEGLLDSEVIEMQVAINHSEEAIQAHKKNNPEVVHLTEDIRNIQKIFPHLPSKVNLLWASAECTHFSGAAGGRSRDADSRSLSDDLVHYVLHCNPDYFMIENIKEFRTWGPLIYKRNKSGKIIRDKKGKRIQIPDPKQKGLYYNAWVKLIKSLGYEYQYMDLNCADYGVPTSRVRYFGIFARTGLPISFPEPTHSKKPDLRNLKPWVACRDYIDLEDEGNSIFGREPRGKKPLVDKTLARVGYGFKKYCMQDFIAKYFGVNGTPNSVSSMNDPLHTIRTKDCHTKITIEKDKRHFISQHVQQGSVSSIDNPIGTLLTKDEKHMITSQFITKQQYGADQVHSMKEPLHTITTHGRKQLVTTKDQFINSDYSGGGQNSSLDDPMKTITGSNHHRLVTVEKRDFFRKYVTDDKEMVEILADYIVDIKMRYLNSEELARITGFKENTYLGRTETIRKYHIGNAVPPRIPKLLARNIAFVNGLCIDQAESA